MRRQVLLFVASVGILSTVVGMRQAAAPEKKQDPAAEKKPEAPAVGVQQDRLDIAGTIDSWYRVEQGGLPVGFVHEVLTRVPAGNPWRYNYDVDAEIEMVVRDPKEPGKELPSIQASRIRAKLDDTYAPVDWQEFMHFNGVEISGFISVDESGARKVEIVLSATDRRQLPVPAEEEVYFDKSLLFISLRQSGNLARPGNRKVSLFSPQADGKASVAEVTFEVGEMVRREYMGKKDVPVTRIRFLKPPPAPTRDSELAEAFIDKYGRMVEWVARGGMRTVLVKGEEEAVGKDRVLRHAGRRDPFRKDLAMTRVKAKEGEKPEGETIRPPTDLQQFTAELAKATKLIEDLKKAKEEQREAEGEEVYQKLLAYHQAFRKSLQEKPQSQEISNQVEMLRRQAEEIWGGAERLVKKLRLVYVRIMDLFDRDDCDEMAKGIEELKKAQTRLELQDTPQLLEVNSWVLKVEPLLTKCRTRMELARKKIELSGTIAYEERIFYPVDGSVSVFGHTVGAATEVRFVKPSRLAVINEKVYRIGDVVEGEGVRVEKIWPQGVQVSLREETRDVGIRQ
jgi:hypothetical protein